MNTDADDALVRCEVSGRVATITLDSPANRNALSQRLVGDLLSALDAAERAAGDGAVRSLVLTHTPPVFCAGADLKARAGGGPALDSRPLVEAMRRLMDSRVPTIAAVTGPVRAGGIGLMASCDLVVVPADITLALTEVRVGVAAAIISVPIFRRASASHLAAAFLTGEVFDAEAARTAGLVTHVTADAAAVAATVDELCAGVAAGAPGAVAATKRLLAGAYDGDRQRRDDEFEAMRALSESLFAGDEAAEGMAAFAAKRPPRWVTAPLE